MRTSRLAKQTSKVTRLSSRGIADVSTEESQPEKAFTQRLRRYAASSSIQETRIKDGGENEDDDQDNNDVGVPSTPPLSTSSLLKRKRFSSSSSVSPVKVKVESPTTENLGLVPSPARAAARKRQPAKKVTLPSGEVAIHPPLHWEEVYEAVRGMRAKELAPVDTMGCETLAEDEADPKDKRLQTLIALMLSSQTKDTTTAFAIRQLQTSLPPHTPGGRVGLTLPNLLSCDPVLLNKLIHSVGFHNNKTVYIKKTAGILQRDFGGDIPSTPEGLMSLPGVGPKMAYLCMSAAWGQDLGIGVDVHVHRITNLWGWHKTRNPEETRLMLEAWLPREKWHEINHLLVGFGQTLCKPVGRECGRCEVGDKGLCPGMVRGAKGSPIKKQKVVKVELESSVGDMVKEQKLVVKQASMPSDEELQGNVMEDIENIRLPPSRVLRPRMR